MKRKCAYIRVGYGIIILAMSIFYMIIRAHYLMITLDEAHTYIDYVTEFRFGNISGFLQNYDGRANNHLLNTVLMWIMDRLSGIHYDEFILRFPNVCFGVGYCIFCFVLYYKKEISAFLFSLLVLNEFLMETFALGRGYGLATCLTAVAVYYIKRYVESDDTEFRYLSLAICFFTLAESANTVVLLLTASTAVLVFVRMIKRKTLLSYLKQAWAVLIPLAVCNILLLAYHLYVSADGDGKALASFHGNPVTGIVGSFVEMYTGHKAGIYLFLILLIGAFVHGIYQKRNCFFIPLFFIYFVLCSIMAIAVGKGMPSGNALLPACPMIVFAIGEAVEILWNDIFKALFSRYSQLIWCFFSVCVCLFCLRHFVNTVDFEVNNRLRVKLYDSVLGNYEEDFDTEEFRLLHTSFYQKQFLYRYGYDIYQHKYTIETMSLGETLRMLSNRKFDAIIEIDNKQALKQYSYEFKKLGIDIRNLPEETDYILLKWNSDEPMQYIYNLKGSNNTQETIMGKMDLFYGEEDSYGVYLNGYECLAVKQKEEKPIAAVCVWQDKEEPMDYKVYME